MIPVIDLAITFLEMYLGKMSNKLPAEVVAAIGAAIDALSAHKTDLLTKANMEAARG